MGIDAFTWFGLAWAIATAAALKSIWHRAGHSRAVKLIWSALAILVPILGAAGWFLLGREQRR